MTGLVVLNVLLGSHDNWLQNVVFEHLEPWYVLPVPVDVVHVKAEVAFLVIQSLGCSAGVPLVNLYFFVEHLFSLLQCLFALEFVELL